LNRREVGHSREFMFRFRIGIVGVWDRFRFRNRFHLIQIERLRDNVGVFNAGFRNHLRF
jgi:hypothetical protein